MPVKSSEDWNVRGTHEEDIRDVEVMSPTGIYKPHMIGRRLTEGPAPGTVDPQPFNPDYQLQTGILDWINVQSLGAAGNGIQDDTGYFQAANIIAQIPFATGSSGRMIYIPAGNYKLTQNVTFDSGTQWLNMGTITGGTLSGGSQVSFGSNSLTNPMTTLGDLIRGGGGGTPQRLGIGTANQVLTVIGGVPIWATSPAGFSNPMTTNGDIIIQAGGIPARLGVGGSSQVLGVSGGLPAWVNPASGFANPMTTTGDIIYSTDNSGDAGRLPVGTSGQVLTVQGGIPSWQAASSGFTNPMTTTGDLIYSTNNSGNAGRLGLGSSGQVLGISSGVPSWVTPASAANLPFAVMIPSGDTSGATDNTHFNSAVSSLPNGGIIYFAPGIFYTNAQWIVPQNISRNATQSVQGNPVSLQGSPSTIICGVGTFTTGVVYFHRSVSYGAQYSNPADPSAGFIHGIVIDGTFATGASVGLDVGDARGIRIDATCQNFDGTGQVGCNIINRLSWTEKSWFRMEFYNNQTACRISTTLTPSGDHSNEYNNYDFTLFANQNQNGIVVDGTNQGGCNLWLKGNMCQTTSTTPGAPTNNVAALSIINAAGVSPADGHRWYFGSIWMKIEGNATTQFPPVPPTNGTFPYGIYSDGVGYIRQCTGFIGHSLTNSNLNNAEFSFHGGIAGDTNLSQAFPSTPGSQNTLNPGANPAVPATGVAQQNYGPDALVCVSGGTVSSIGVNNQTTGLTSGAFYVNAGGSITLNYSVAPTWNWCPAAQMSN